jgi:fructan beta-fructosidase
MKAAPIAGILVSVLFHATSALAAADSTQTDSRTPDGHANPRRKFTVEKRYLNLPVKNGAPKRRVNLRIDGQKAREFEIELADRDPDFWVFVDLGADRGKPAILEVDKLREDSSALDLVNQSDEFEGAENLYREKLRPQFHFSSRRGWNNDPNGLVFYKGEYHLFYQHNPYGWSWGNMHWGHAVSSDLLHWQELGDALYPDELGTMFSGSAVVDAANTAGFAQGDEKALVCVYTAAGGTSPGSQGRRFSQCVAYSTDKGRTWTKYEKNPVLPHVMAENRDPKVIWYEPQQKWIMALYLDKNDYALFSSPDLKQWEKLCVVSLPGTNECPEFFEIAVDGDRSKTRWVFYGGNGRYLVGRFDGKAFNSEAGPQPLNFGNCFYASQTFNGIPSEDGRRILIAWGQVNLPAMPFNQMMNFPVELTLRTTEEGLRLFAYPVKEIEKMHGQKHGFKAQPLNPGDNPLAGLKGALFDIAADLVIGDAQELGFVVRGVPIIYDAKRQELQCLGKTAALRSLQGKIQLRLVVDRASVEIFGDNGRLYMPMGVIPDESDQSLAVFARGGAAGISSLSVHTMNSIWNPAAAD